MSNVAQLVCAKLKELDNDVLKVKQFEDGKAIERAV